MTTPPALNVGQGTSRATVADVLDRLVDVAASVSDGGRPSDERNPCVMCHLSVTEAREHEPWCGYRVARTQLSPADFEQVRRLARVLRYAD